MFLTVTDTDKSAVDGHRRPAARPRLPDRRDARDGRVDLAHGHPRRAAQQDRRGLAARRRLDRATATSTSSSTRRPAPRRAPTATRSAAPPSPAASRASPRSPAAWPPRARSPPARVGEPGRRVAAGAPRARGGDARMSARVVTPARRDVDAADATRRSVAGGRRGTGAPSAPYAVLPRRSRRARARTPASSTCSPRPSAGAGERTSGRSCRARSRVMRATTTASSTSCSRTSGPAPTACASCAPGDELHLLGPLGSGFAPPRDGRRPMLVGGGVGIAPLAIWGDALGGARRRCSASATPRTPRAPR